MMKKRNTDKSHKNKIKYNYDNRGLRKNLFPKN